MNVTPAYKRRIVEEFHGIKWCAIFAYFEVKIGAGHPPGTADIADQFPPKYLGAGRQMIAGSVEVGIPSRQPVAVPYFDEAPIGSIPTDLNHLTVRCRRHRSPGLRRIVDPFVRRGRLVRVTPRAETRTNISIVDWVLQSDTTICERRH